MCFGGALQITRLVRLRINGGHPLRDSVKLLDESDLEDLVLLLWGGCRSGVPVWSCRLRPYAIQETCSSHRGAQQVLQG